jgi:hypothetical protein
MFCGLTFNVTVGTSESLQDAGKYTDGLLAR